MDVLVNMYVLIVYVLFVHRHAGMVGDSVEVVEVRKAVQR